MKQLQKSIALAPGGIVGVASTGSPVHPDRYAAGVAELERRGYRVRAPLDPSAYYGDYRHGFSNGSAEERTDALLELLADPAVHVILTARGGYGALDILPRLDFDRVAAARKLIVGMSDATVLLVNAPQRAGIASVHGPALGTAFADAAQDSAALESIERLLALLTDPAHRASASCTVLRDGTGEGPLLVGNLSVLTTLLGTPWDVDYDGRVLVIEDVGEKPFRIHRALLQLALAGKLKALAGLVFGRFARCDAPHGPNVDGVIRLVLDDILAAASYPVLSGLELGHWGANLPLPVGCRASIHEGRIEVLEAPI